MDFDRNQIFRVARMAAIIVGIVVLSRVTKNWIMAVVALMGIIWALQRQVGRALVVYLLMSVLPMVNPFIMPRYAFFSAIARLSSIVMSLAIVMSAHTMNPRNRIPLGVLFAYLCIAVVSSINGYMPIISYLKIANFALLIVAIYIGTQDIDCSPGDIRLLKDTFFALAFLFTYGSLLARFFPHVSYMTSMRNMIMRYGVDYAVASGEGRTLFSGISVHSQVLGPLIAAFFGWLLCDLYRNNPPRKSLHLILMAPMPIVMFMTRARVALLAFVVAVFAAQRFCLSAARRLQMRRSYRKIRMYATLLLFLLAIGGGVAEARNGTITRWVRKTDAVAEDERSLGDALMSSRQGKIEENIADFKRSPIWGSGFQVTPQLMEAYRSGSISIFAAPIEKGILPLMVLGETGIVGGFVFLVFLLVFFTTCKRQRYYATATLFCVYLATNMAEATFFSPAGAGGVLWFLLVAGGFFIDMEVKSPNYGIGQMPLDDHQPPPNFADSDFDPFRGGVNDGVASNHAFVEERD